MVSKIIGKVAGSSAVLELRCGSTIDGVDELIAPPAIDEFVAPGFLDVQVNGFAGADYNDPAVSMEEIARSVQVMFTTGVTRFFPTIITGSNQRITEALRNLAKIRRELLNSGRPEGLAMEAFHVEGPYISPDDGPRGAHPKEHVRPPDMEEFQSFQEAADGNIRLVTISPEWPQTPSFIKNVTRMGVVASIGHTKASTDQIAAAVDAGASMSTHLGNGSFSVLPKTANYIWDQVSNDRLTASFIVDGIHLPASFTKAAIRAKGIEHSVLVTDAVMPAMCEPGEYNLGQVEVVLNANGSVTLRGGDRLAGSALRMDHAIGNCVRLAGVTLSDAITMATTNVARVGRISSRQKGLVPGEKADLVRYRWNATNHQMTIVETIVGGAAVFSLT